MQCTVGSSNAPSAIEAGKTAALQAKSGAVNPKVAFVYSSVAYDSAELLKGVKEVLPGTPIIGNTSFTGVITPNGYITGDDGFVGVFLLSGDFKVSVKGLEKKDSARSTGKKVAEEAIGKTDSIPDYFYMVSPPGEEEFYLKGISEVIGRKPVFGGSAADNSISGEWKVFTDEGVFADGAAAAFFYGGEAVNLFTGAYRETENFGIITKVRDNRVLVEIDGVPAVKKYAEWRGLDPDTLSGGNLLVATITSPLGVKDRLGDLTAIRHPMNGNEDYSMNIGANLAEKTAVIRMEATVEELIASAADTLKALKAKMKGEAAGYLLVHCGGRRAGIGDRINEVADIVKAEAGDVPFIMQFTFGEYGFEDDGNNSTGGLMLSYTGFGK
jgi:hypothetical protein